MDVTIREVKPIEFGQIQHHIRERIRIERIISDAEYLQLSQPGEGAPREGAGEIITTNVEDLKLDQRGHFGNYTAERVEGEVKEAEAGAAVKFFGDATGEAIGPQGERGERRKPANNIKTDFTGDAGAGEVDFRNRATRITLDPGEAAAMWVVCGP